MYIPYHVYCVQVESSEDTPFGACAEEMGVLYFDQTDIMFVNRVNIFRSS